MSAVRRLALLLAGLLVLLAVPACGVLGSSPPSYHVTAYFDEAVALYPHSKVKDMGMNVGTVSAVTIDHSRVRVDMEIHRDVPLSTATKVTIQALTIIGERNVVLSPAWKPGEPKMQDHLQKSAAYPDGRFVISKANTMTPVEPDDGLKEFRDLAAAIDPNQLASLITKGADAFSGNAGSFNEIVHSTSTVTASLASQDGELIQTAQNLHALASAVNAHDQQLGHVLDTFSQASSTLASQRQSISTLLSGADQLVGAGTSLLDAYKGTLPGDLAKLSQLGLVLQANEAQLPKFVEALPAIGQGLLNAFDPATGQVKLGASVASSLAGAFREPLCFAVDNLPAALKALVAPLFAGLCG